MKRTPLYEAHVSLGARITAFGGWEMPVWYAGFGVEHRTVREAVGVFDVSHMGELVVHGPDAEGFLRKMLTNDAAALEVNAAQYSLMPNEAGGTVDDLLLYRLGDDAFLMVVNAANIDKDRDWLEQHRTGRVEIDDQSMAKALIAVQGPLAPALVAELTALPVWQMGYYHFDRGEVAGVQSLLSRTGYTGEDGFEIMVDAHDAVNTWHAVLEQGAEHGIRPIGLAARDSLRLEAGMALYGNELDDETSALEAGLGYFVKLDKPEMMGLERFRREKAHGVRKKLVSLVLTGRGIPRHGYPILASGDEVGVVTSGTLSPTLGVPIAMGYVPPEHAALDTQLAIGIRGRRVPAKVVRRPFYRRSDRS